VELDELKAIWAKHDERLERTAQLNGEMLARWGVRNSLKSLRVLFGSVLFEAAADLVAIVLIGSFAADHYRNAELLAPAVILGAYAIAIFAAMVGQAVALAAIHYDEPILAIQIRLQRLRERRIRTTLGILLFAPLVWLPFTIVAMQGIFGVNVAEADPVWLVANFLFGVAVIPVGVYAARRFGPRLKASSAMRAVADEIAGRSLAVALEDLAAIGRFAGES
jgi:hypothetical protein